jgi:hypothetical protein
MLRAARAIGCRPISEGGDRPTRLAVAHAGCHGRSRAESLGGARAIVATLTGSADPVRRRPVHLAARRCRAADRALRIVAPIAPGGALKLVARGLSRQLVAQISSGPVHCTGTRLNSPSCSRS